MRQFFSFPQSIELGDPTERVCFIRHDPVDSDVDQVLHRRWIVDRPDMNRQSHGFRTGHSIRRCDLHDGLARRNLNT
jgi:hypothetical protein